MLDFPPVARLQGRAAAFHCESFELIFFFIANCVLFGGGGGGGGEMTGRRYEGPGFDVREDSEYIEHAVQFHE